MALVFSRVTVTANNESESLLVGAIPRTHQDLEGWVLYDTFLDMLNEDANISVHGQICQVSASDCPGRLRALPLCHNRIDHK